MSWFPDAASQMRTVVSNDPDTTRAPSPPRENATEYTALVWPAIGPAHAVAAAAAAAAGDAIIAEGGGRREDVAVGHAHDEGEKRRKVAAKGGGRRFRCCRGTRCASRAAIRPTAWSGAKGSKWAAKEVECGHG